MADSFTNCSQCGCALPAPARLNVCARCAFHYAAAPVAELPEIEGCEILGLAGEGGMGRVFRARQTAAGGRVVAVKVLPPGALSPLADERFAREAALLARLSHPSVAAVYGAGLTEAGERYLMMEWIEGCPLPEALRSANAGAQQIAAAVALACDGVQAAHAINVVHRDLKPANLLASGGGRQVKVLDFGLARDLEELRGLSLSGAVLGTPDYMAPEQIRGEPCGPPADVFALGIVLHLCLTGRHPFPAQSLPQRLHASTEAHPAGVNASLPRDLRAILHKALEASPARRYRNAGDLAEDLRRWVDGRPVMAQPPDVFYLLRKFAMRHRAAVAAAVLVLLSAAAAAVWHWHSQEQAERELRAQYAETLLVSAELHGQRGQWIPALEEIEKAESSGARDPGRTALAKIEALLAAGRRDDARRVLSGLKTTTLTAHPGLVDYWRAQLIDGAAGTEEAAALLRRAGAAGLPPAQRLICDALLSDDEAATEARLLEAVQLEPWNHQALLLHAFALAFTGRDAEALAAAASAARLFPQSRDLAFCTHFLQARSGSAPAEESSDPFIADMHFLQQQRAGIYDLAWQRGGNAITRVFKAKSILSRVNASPLFGKLDAAAAAGEAVPALVLRFILRLHERELRSVQLLHAKPQNLAALREMLEAEHRRSRPSVIVICHCASALLTPALGDDKLSALIEAACGRMAADPAILDGERALMLEMCATQTLYRLPGNTDPALRTRSTDYVRRRLAIPIPCAAMPACVLSQGMVTCGEYALARQCAEAARTDNPGDPGIILQQATVEQKAGQWQRCLEFTGQLPASSPTGIRQQMDQIRAEAVQQLQELARELSGPQ